MQVRGDVLGQFGAGAFNVAGDVEVAVIVFKDLLVADHPGIAVDFEPLVEGQDDAFDVLLAQAILVPVLFEPLAGIDHEDAFVIVGVLLVDHDDARRDASAVEEVCRQAHDPRDVLALQYLLADRFFRITPEQNTVRHDDCGLAVLGQGLQNMQEPRPVAVLLRGNPVAVKPVVHIIGRGYAVRPRLVGERRVHHDKVELCQLPVFVDVLRRRQSRVSFDFARTLLMEHQVHLRQASRRVVLLLTVDRHDRIALAIHRRFISSTNQQGTAAARRIIQRPRATCAWLNA